MKYCAASRLVVEQVQDDPRRKKTARRRLLNANLMIVDQAAISQFRPHSAPIKQTQMRPSVANGGGEDGIGVAETDPSVEIFKLPKLSVDPSEPSNPSIEADS